MNQIEIEIERISNENSKEFHGINFSNCHYLTLKIDGTEVFPPNHNERPSFIVWEELINSSKQSGEYLIFTCVCGIADDGDFQYLSIRRFNKRVTWVFNDNSNIKWEFDQIEYDKAIKKIDRELNKVDNLSTLEPSNIIEPEST